MYEMLPVRNVTYVGDQVVETDEVVTSGRTSYMIFEKLVALLTGLQLNSQGGDSDLIDAAGVGYEAKAFADPLFYVTRGDDAIHCSASSTFGANNQGKVIKALLIAGNYPAALAICLATGFNKNGFYIFTATRKYKVGRPVRFVIVSKEWVLAHLDPHDPRIVSRAALLASVTRTQQICF